MKRSVASDFGLFVLVITCWIGEFAHAAAGVEGVIEIPFEFVRGAIVVQTAVNGHGPLWMMLDTGADPSIVDLGTAKSIGLRIEARGQQGSGGGTAQNLAYETDLHSVQLGGLSASNVDALAQDLSKLSSALGRPISGVLGYSLLKARIVQIDYPNRKVRFFTTAPSCNGIMNRSSQGCTTLLFRYEDDIVASGVTVDGKAVRTNIDTGSNSNFQFTPAAVKKLSLSKEVARGHPSDSVGFNGNLKNREGNVRKVTVGTISVDNPTVVFFGKGMGMDKEPWDLRIGNGFLKNFVVTLNYPDGQLTLSAP